MTEFPTIDHRVLRVGVSWLREATSERLREIAANDEIVLMQAGPDPVAVMVPYEMYLRMLDTLKGPTSPPAQAPQTAGTRKACYFSACLNDAVEGEEWCPVHRHHVPELDEPQPPQVTVFPKCSTCEHFKLGSNDPECFEPTLIAQGNNGSLLVRPDFGCALHSSLAVQQSRPGAQTGRTEQ